MVEVLKIALYGDSLALPRKGVVKYNERYIFLIQQWLKNKYGLEYLEVIDRAKGAVSISELLAKYEHDIGYYDLPGDIVIFQSGIVDCAPRPINENTRSIIGKLPSLMKKVAINYLHKNRSKILQKGKFYVRTEKDVFYSKMKTLINKATQNYKRVYFITICPTNEKTEKHSPGLTKKIDEYNSIIKNVTEEAKNANVFLIDINKYINEKYSEIDNYVLKDDGHHITALAHSVIASKVIENEINFIN